MSLYDYFESTQGMGVLATADGKGIVDTAMYARPHIIDDEQCIFLMADKHSHRNLQENPHASYIFIQQSKPYKGKRLYLTKTEESHDAALINKIRRKKHGCPAYEECEDTKTFVVYFKVDSVRPLVGDTETHTHAQGTICPTCLENGGDSGHLCVPVDKKDETCSWCGSLIVNERHVCNEKVKELAYICNSCGRTAVRADHLCKPKKIEN
ncbi:MAG: pyridoxamine 5'-phosphate oxidase family protein [bacterium]